jgi:lipase
MLLHVHEFGDSAGEPLICLHGLSGHGARFRRLAGLLDGRRVVAPDLRGHGRSGREPPWDTETHLADVVESVESLGIGSADWLGFSFGGLLLATLAATEPARVARACLLDPALSLPAGEALERAERDRQELTFASADEAIHAELADGSLFSTPRELLEEEMEDNLVRRSDGRLEYRWLRSMAVAAWSEMAREPPPVAEVPTLLVTGDRSWIEIDVGRYPNATLVTVAGGHSILFDALEETAAAVARFLSGSGSTFGP